MALTLVAASLLVGAHASVSTANDHHDQKTAPPKSRSFCSLPQIKWSAATNAVSGSSHCLVNGKANQPKISFKYYELDHFGYQCGAAVSKQGNSFSLRYPNANTAVVSFTATSTAKANGRYIKRSLPPTQILLGHNGMDCLVRHQFDIAPLPTGLTYICGYPFRNVGYDCGVVMGPDGIPLDKFAAVPFWADHPALKGDTFSIPPFATPSGACEEEVGEVAVPWMGSQLRSSKWICPDGIYIVPQWYIYLSPNDPKGGPGNHPTPSCQAGDFNIVPPPHNSTSLPLGGDFSSITLPSSWVGRVDIVLRMKVFRGPGADTDPIISLEYADDSVYPNPNGTVNGCTQLLGKG